MDQTVDCLAALAGEGRALEFAVGTGRVAIPLAERGVPVTGIELSPPMIEQLRTRATDTQIPVVVGDMTTAQAPGEFTLAYLVYNTISNLLTQAEQVACFQNAARHLTPGGCFVIELWVPELRKLPPGSVGHRHPLRARVHRRRHLRRPVAARRLTPLSLRTGSGSEGLSQPTPLLWPAELDLMAQLAGFELESRHADWQSTEFTEDSRSHVSVYRLRTRPDSAGRLAEDACQHCPRWV